MDFEGLVFRGRESYQRDDFDAFLHDVHFSYVTPSIHIAGTNGKGSTATYLSTLYQAAGYKVGLFTSPFLVINNEMISINGVFINDEEAKQIIEPVKDKIVKHKLSSFEIETYIAFRYFDMNECDIGIIECGMGGEIDATNVFEPILSIITSVGLEHTNFLGVSYHEVAAHKAGIIKRGVPVLISNLNEESELTVSSIAKSKKSTVYKVREINSYSINENGAKFSFALFPDINLPSLAYYEIKDCCIALEAALLLKEKLPFCDEIVENCFKNTKISARLEVIKSDPIVIIDGAHNPDAINALVESMNIAFPTQNIHIIFASFLDKNISLMLPKLAVLSNDLTLTTFEHERARKIDDYFIYADDYCFEQDYKTLIKRKISECKGDVILITGSLAFAGLVSDEFKKGEYR